MDFDKAFICPDCGNIFAQPAVRTIEFDDGYAINMDECPECGCENFTRAERCDACGEYIQIDEEYVETYDGTILCSNCYEIKSY